MPDVKSLTASQKDALKRLAAGKWFRQRGGYSCPGKQFITLSMAAELRHKGLAEEGLRNGIAQLWLTASGLVAVRGLPSAAKVAS